ncbi:permease-like cell division protein FtsX [Streptosporangium amethystogenes]|uniref:permease-like cell division protein FtsX n=1 Tax=Streptosporangium amethystogenes TaxID=2002 RepID=UPI00378D2025
MDLAVGSDDGDAGTRGARGLSPVPTDMAAFEAEKPSLGSPGWGSRGRRWAGGRRALLTGAVVAAVVLGTVGSVGSPLLEGTARGAASPDGPWPGNKKVSPPPDDWPQGGTFSVFLCKDRDPFEQCRERAITAKQRRALEARLRSMPEVAEVEFESREEAYANFREANADNKVLLSAIWLEDMPESFNGRLHRWRDLASFGSAMDKVPGVSNVLTFGGFFWQGRADVVVSLCGRKGTIFACKGRGPATVRERKAVGAKLVALPESESVYFENIAHARRVFAYVWAKKSSDVPLPESYYIKLADPAGAPAIIDAVEGMAGVGSAGRADEGCYWPGIAQECSGELS